jgi:hypothetical protein
MKQPYLQGVGSIPGFWLAWILGSIVAAVCMYLPPAAMLRWLGVAERLNLDVGLLYLSLSQLILFWLVAAGGQGMALRWRLPHGRRWGFLTFIGGMVATIGYMVAGSAFAPVWTEFLGVQVRQFGVPLFFIRPNYLQETLLIAAQGAVFGGLLAFLQATALPFGWRGRLYLVVLSAFVGAASLDLVWFVATLVMMTPTRGYSGFVFRAVGLSVPIPPLLWITYSALTGIALHYAIKRWRGSERDAITSAFD